MPHRSYRVREVAQLTGLTVRTLHHYDAIGLVSPPRTASGYRTYGEDDLLRLQQVLVYRELGLALEQIKTIVHDPTFDRRAALLDQRMQLQARVDGATSMIRAIDAALETMKGDREMNAKQLFDGFDPSKYEDETRARWGQTDAYKESARRTKAYTREDWQRINRERDTTLRKLADLLAAGKSPTDPAAVELAEAHRLHIDRYYYPCSHDMHAKLAQMYTGDPRFEANLNRFGEGVAAFLAAAIRANGTQPV